jgi:MOSC domain-containing protein YiiM
METLHELTRRHPRQGKVVWIGLRSARRQPMTTVESVEADTSQGMVGDRYQGKRGTRQVTLIQAEHLRVLAALTGQDSIAPETLRRNIVVSGINLLALKDQRFQIGDAVLEFTGLCHPCSHMEEVLGPGGYNAMRGHGGITARVVSAGHIRSGDSLTALPDNDDN